MFRMTKVGEIINVFKYSSIIDDDLLNSFLFDSNFEKSN